MKRWLIWLPFVAFAAVLWVVASGLLSPAERVVRSKLIDTPLPAFTLPPMIDGKPGVTSAATKGGEPRLLNVFASWCVPCIAEAPQLEAIQRAGVRIDGIAIRDTPDAVRRFLATNGDPYAGIGSDPMSKVQLSLGSSGVPETFVIDGRGRIVLQHIGDIRADDVPAILDAVQRAR